MPPSKVYFTRDITPPSLVKAYDVLAEDLSGKIAVKISTGEPGGHNYLKPALIKDLVDKFQATICECNTAYGGKRSSVAGHLQTATEHGFTDIAPIDIMDSEGELEIPVTGGKHLDVDIVGSHLPDYDGLINLAHFKGHAMGGFGGVIKNQSIGLASRAGKVYIHSAGQSRDPNAFWDTIAAQNDFLESMAEAAKAVADYYHTLGKKIVYLNVMNNLSVDCDCDSDPEDPCMADIGILSSTDPVAADQAAIDLIWQSTDPGRDHFVERVERQNGRHLLPYAESIGLGSRQYELVDLDQQ